MPQHPPCSTAASTRGRLMLTGVILGSGVAILDGSVVNVALRTIGRDLDASLAQLQWVVNGYLLALASLVLVGGSLGDRFGRRRVYLIGVASYSSSPGCVPSPRGPASSSRCACSRASAPPC